MKRLILPALVALALAGGCAAGKKSAANPAVTDLSPLPVAATPAPAPMAAPIAVEQPVSDSATTLTPAAPAAGRKYTVKKGDTLWSIAQRNYGDGKQYSRIVAANPGLSAGNLKAGQTLTLP